MTRLILARPRGRIAAHAARLVEQIRADKSSYGDLDAFIQEHDLSNQEGVVLMCLAEALLRVPDAATADKLIAETGEQNAMLVDQRHWLSR